MNSKLSKWHIVLQEVYYKNIHKGIDERFDWNCIVKTNHMVVGKNFKWAIFKECPLCTVCKTFVKCHGCPFTRYDPVRRMSGCIVWMYTLLPDMKKLYMSSIAIYYDGYKKEFVRLLKDFKKIRDKYITYTWH